MKMSNLSVTWISTPGWLSEYVVNVCVCLVGIVVLRLIRDVITPPAVSIPRDSGATSNNSRSCTASDLSPCRIAACTAKNSYNMVTLPFISVRITTVLFTKKPRCIIQNSSPGTFSDHTPFNYNCGQWLNIADSTGISCGFQHNCKFYLY